jgi:hypothetical protein
MRFVKVQDIFEMFTMRLVQLGCENKDFNPFNLIIKFPTFKVYLHLQQDRVLNSFPP